MGNFARFWIFFGSCALFAAVASPWLYLGVHEAAVRMQWPWLEYLARHPFHRYFNRVLQASILIGIWGLLKQSGFGSLRAVGLERNGSFRFFSIGFLSSLVFLGGYVGLAYGLGWLRLQENAANLSWLSLAGKILLTAAVVSLLEEVFFRGYFYQLCRREIGPLRALVLNVVFFSLLHYIKPPRLEDLSSVDWSAGFQMLAMAGQRFLDPLQIFGGILVLMGVAWILCWSLDRTSHLDLAIGLHAGWIVALQGSSELMRNATGWPTWLLGGGDLSQGIMALAPLSLQFLALRIWLARAKGRIPRTAGAE